MILYGIAALTTMAFNEPLNQDLVDAGDPSRIGDVAYQRKSGRLDLNKRPFGPGEGSPTPRRAEPASR
jgi:hypothetical protein